VGRSTSTADPCRQHEREPGPPAFRETWALTTREPDSNRLRMLPTKDRTPPLPTENSDDAKHRPHPPLQRVYWPSPTYADAPHTLLQKSDVPGCSIDQRDCGSVGSSDGYRTHRCRGRPSCCSHWSCCSPPAAMTRITPFCPPSHPSTSSMRPSPHHAWSPRRPPLRRRTHQSRRPPLRTGACPTNRARLRDAHITPATTPRTRPAAGSDNRHHAHAHGHAVAVGAGHAATQARSLDARRPQP
jgi:hypothetical protein